MARPKGSKNGVRAAASNPSSGRTISIQLTDEMILSHFSASELLDLVQKQIARQGRGQNESTMQAPGVETSPAPKRKKFSAEARAKMAEAQRQRWAKARKGK